MMVGFSCRSFGVGVVAAHRGGFFVPVVRENPLSAVLLDGTQKAIKKAPKPKLGCLDDTG